MGKVSSLRNPLNYEQKLYAYERQHEKGYYFFLAIFYLKIAAKLFTRIDTL
jgi:hypothetical protein